MGVRGFTFHGIFIFSSNVTFCRDTGRVREMWRVAPNRVGVFLNDKGTQIEYYTVDGMQVPNGSVVGGLIVFYGNDEGLLNRAGKTIRTGSELERAAAMYAREPVPSMVFKIKWHSITS
jgi:hypothetical protein